jgi:tRNA 2-thiouridine synthesizing protein A
VTRSIEMTNQTDESRVVAERIDLRGTPCPMNWVKTKLRLEQMETGQVLEVLVDDGDAILSLPRSVKTEGHKVVKVTPIGPDFSLLIEKSGRQD